MDLGDGTEFFDRADKGIVEEYSFFPQKKRRHNSDFTTRKKTL
jgi:hypothetical protein